METLPLLLSALTTTRAETEMTLTDLEMTLIDLETTTEMVVEIAEALSTTTAEAAMETTIRRDNVTLIVIAVTTQDQAQTSLPVATTPAPTSPPTISITMEETRASWPVPPSPKSTGAKWN